MYFKKGMRDKLEKYINVNEKFELKMSISGKSTYDFVCFGLNEHNNIVSDEYVIFYNQLCTPNNDISFLQSENTFSIDLKKIPREVIKLVFTVSIDGNGCMNQIDNLSITFVQNNNEVIQVESTGIDYKEEKSLILIEVYLKEVWRTGVVLNGFNEGLPALLRYYGGEEASSVNEVSSAKKVSGSENMTQPQIMQSNSSVSHTAKVQSQKEVKETEYFNCEEKNNDATKVSIKYNPYTVETDIYIDNKRVESPNRLCDVRNERLQVWIDQLMPILIETSNDNVFEVDFYGLRLDYDDLYITLKEYCDNHDNIKVSLHFTEAKGSEDRLKELQALFDSMQNDCPFEDLKTDQIKENFKNAMSSEFEVSVIATMSSGKSTIINSILGQELMPSKNEACTATIARIKDTNFGVGFSAKYKDKNNNVLGAYQNLCLEDMEKMNDNKNTAYIDIEGNIPNIDSSGIKLVLVDTPGPNNSKTEAHKEHTYKVIKEKTKPMILYVLNATQLQTKDDQQLMNAVADAMKVGGKQSKDRFIFAVNKIDQFDPDKESVQDALNNVREYLKQFDIENPNLFPTSAETAKVIRMLQNGATLTRGQNKTLTNCDFFISEQQLHLSEQASLSKNNLAIINERIYQAKQKGDIYEEVLLYTGVPAVELAINEYLKKYAYTTKIKTAVDTFRKKVEEKDIYAQMLASVSDNEEERNKIHQQLEKINQIFEEGKEAEKFRKKIESLDMAQEAKKRIRLIRAKISKELKPSSNNGTMTTLEVQQMLMSLNNTVQNLQSDVKTELDNIISEVVVSNAELILKDYTNHIHNLIESGLVSEQRYDGMQNSGLNFLEMEIPNAQELISNYKYNERYEAGEEWVENRNKKWYKPWTWFEEKGHWKTIYEEREVVDYSTVENEYLTPIISSFNENLEGAQIAAQNEANKFKIFFLNQLDELDDALKKTIEENKKLTQNSESIKKMIDDEKEKINWLENFMIRLDSILEI